jgi:MarR family transcriptional regulator, lower aerobic nicotinate degradation pathway regulator
MTREPPPADAMPSRVMEKPTWLISRVYAHSHRLLAEGFAAANARGYHYRLLAALEEFGPASQAALGRRTGIDRSDVVAALNELAGRGLIKRSPDPDDGRRNVITITPAGTEQLGTLDQVLAGVQEKLLAPLSAADRRQLIGLLARLLDHDAQP